MKKLLTLLSICLIAFSNPALSQHKTKNLKHHSFVAHETPVIIHDNPLPPPPPCFNPPPDKVVISEDIIIPQDLNDTCLNYANPDWLKLNTLDLGTSHQIKQVDTTANTIWESAWFASTDTILIPRVPYHAMLIYINTISGSDTCGYTYNNEYSSEPAIPPVLCNVGSNMSDLVVFPVPVSVGGGVTATFNSTSSGTAFVTLNVLVGNTSTTEWWSFLSVVSGSNSISIPTPQAGLFTVSIQMQPFYLDKTIIVQ